MRPELIIFLPPVGNQYLGLGQCGKDLAVEQCSPGAKMGHFGACYKSTSGKTRNQAFLECVDIPEALFRRHVGTRIIMFVERVDWIGQAIYILHVEARGIWRWTLI
jgi:hypothetical protein